MALRALPQLEALDLAGRRLGQLGHGDEAVRHLEVGHVRAAELAQHCVRGIVSRLEHDVGVRRLAPLGVREPDDRRLLQSLARTLGVVLENVRFREQRRQQEEREQQLRLLASRAELRALRAQINPHFLYNTLDTIIWMAESKKTAQVVEIVSALSSFFRISLSRGMDWITIGEEIERTKSYLIIQKMRYHDILDYQIEVEPEVAEYAILKLILQPLVENALYHGIKNKRQRGTNSVRARRRNESEILLEVEDDGIGFAPDKLAQLRSELEDDSGDIKLESGFGIGNVNKRIRLYYGKPYGVSVRSEYNSGTCVTLIIPAKTETMPKVEEPVTG